MLRLAGRLDLEQSAELLHLFDRTPGVVGLDLTDLLSADADGVGTILSLHRRGAGLVGLTPYLALHLGVGLSERGPISLNDDRSMSAATRHGVAKTRPQENP